MNRLKTIKRQMYGRAGFALEGPRRERGMIEGLDAGQSRWGLCHQSRGTPLTRSFPGTSFGRPTRSGCPGRPAPGGGPKSWRASGRAPCRPAGPPRPAGAELIRGIDRQVEDLRAHRTSFDPEELARERPRRPSGRCSTRRRRRPWPGSTSRRPRRGLFSAPSTSSAAGRGRGRRPPGSGCNPRSSQPLRPGGFGFAGGRRRRPRVAPPPSRRSPSPDPRGYGRDARIQVVVDAKDALGRWA